jgi:hypothetical protein
MVANEITATRPNAVSAAEHFAIEQFLFLEAELLDGRNIAEWIELMADDLRYVMPIHRNVGPRERKLEWTSPIWRRMGRGAAVSHAASDHERTRKRCWAGRIPRPLELPRISQQVGTTNRLPDRGTP